MLRYLSLTILAFVALTATATASTTEFVGTVTANGQPISRVLVEVENKGTFLTNSEGQFYVGRLSTESLQMKITPQENPSDACPGLPAGLPLSVTVSPETNSESFSLPSFTTEIDSPRLSSEEQAFLNQINAERQARGINSLNSVERLDAVSALQATTVDILPDRHYNRPHLGVACESLNARSNALGLFLGAKLNEVQTAGRPTASGAVESFRSSSRHWDALMDSSVTHVGVSQVNGVWVAILSTPDYRVEGVQPSHNRTSPSAWNNTPPQPVAPQPVAPQPVAPQPVAPQPVAPQPVAPQPVTPQPMTYPSKLEVLRAGVENGRLDVLADITARSEGDRVKVEFHARGQKYRFTSTVKDGRISFKKQLPSSQRSVRSGIMTLSYEGNERVRPMEVRLRAANGKSKLSRSKLSLQGGKLTAQGEITSRARGVVRLSLSYDTSTGAAEHEFQATVKDGRWKAVEELPVEARQGGYLTIQFTGYLQNSLRGEQIAKELLEGQSFE